MKNSALAPAKTGDIYAMSAKKRRLRKCGTLLTRIIVYAAAALAVCILLLLIGYILVRGIPALNLDMFAWEYTTDNQSMTPAIINTIIRTLLSLAIADVYKRQHLNIVDLMLLVRKLEGKKCRVPLWIMSTPWLFDVAKKLGYLKIFKDAGASLMTGTCLAAMGGVPGGVRNLAVDSAKQSYYITGCYPDDDNRLQVCYGSQDDCIDAALTGKWRGEWR